MKIALIAPPYPLDEVPSPPLGLTYIAAVCEAAGAQVMILDYIVRGYSETKLIKEIKAFGPDIVGTNSVTMNFKQAASILCHVKQTFPEIITLMGGPHISFDAENALGHYPGIDLVVKGEGEATVPELLGVIHTPEKWQTIQGIAFRQGEQIITTPLRPFIQDLDALPLPARHLLPMSRYQALGYPVSIITSRGCPNQCIFCLGRKMVGQKVRFRSAVHIVDEIEELRSFGFSFINIADDLFTASKRRVTEFCNELVKRKLEISWSAFSRVNTVDTQTLTLMKSAGCHSVSFGIESGNPEMLQRVKKGITIAQAKKAALACREVGIRGHASFMVGLPGETLDTMNDSLNLQKELGIESAFHFLSPFPGTAVREDIEKYDLEILTDDWDLYNANRSIVRTACLTPEQMDTFIHKNTEQNRADWEALKLKYENNAATPHEQMQVGGHYRMEMIFKLLTRDFLEQNGAFDTDGETALETLCAKLSVMADHALDFTQVTIKDLMDKGYIQMETCREKTRFYWSDNRQLKINCRV